jgi:hypothetical protein
MPSLNLTEEQTTALYDYWCDITGTPMLTHRRFSNYELASHQYGTKLIGTARWFGYQIFFPHKMIKELVMGTALAAGLPVLLAFYPPVRIVAHLLSLYLHVQSSLIDRTEIDEKGVIVTVIWTSPGIFFHRPAAPYYTSLPDPSLQIPVPPTSS